MSRALRLYVLLLRLYPRWFRDAYQPEMVRLFEERTMETGRASRGGFWLRTLSDVVVNAALVRWDQARQAARQNSFRRQRKGVGHMRLEEIRRDVQLSIRGMWRQPSFAVLALAMLGLGIGVNAAVFAVVDGVLLRRLPYPEEDRLTAIYESLPNQARARFSPADYEDFAAQNRSYEAVAAYRIDMPTLNGRGEARSVETARTTATYFEVMGVAPMIGRAYTSAEERAQAPVAVLSHRTWRTLYGEDGRVLGNTLTLNGVAHEIIGVMPPEFDYPAHVTAWLPLAPTTDPIRRRAFHFLRLVGRLKEGVSIGTARAEARDVVAGWARDYPDTHQNPGVFIETIRTSIVGESRAALRLVFSAVCCLVLIASSNAAGLFLLRSAARRKEMAVRVALGASRLRITRQVLVEGATYGMVAALIGILVAALTLRGFLHIAGGRLPRIEYVAMNWSIAAYVLGLSICVGGICAITALFGVLRQKLTLSESQRHGSDPASRRARSALVIVQLAFAVMLCIGAGILIRTVAAYYRSDLGFPQDGLYSYSVMLPPADDGGRQAQSFADRTLETIMAVPGVHFAAATMTAPLTGGPSSTSAVVAGSGEPAPVEIQWNVVTPGYFALLGVEILRGRDISRADAANTEPVALLSESAARRLFGDQNAVGRLVNLGPDPSEPPVRIIGVTADVRLNPLEEDEPTVYQALAQEPVQRLVFVLRTDREDAAVVEQIRARVTKVDPNIALLNFGSLRTQLALFTNEPRFNATVVGSFASIALLLAVAGVYGLLSYCVAVRRQEIALRLAIGAQRAGIARMILRDASTVVIPGIALGVLCSLAAARLLTSLAFGVTATDVATYLTVVSTMLVIAMVGASGPAVRAASTDPMTALRD